MIKSSHRSPLQPADIESETFDLAGSNATTIAHIIRDAFTDPFPQMLRLTFITVRWTYDELAASQATSHRSCLAYRELES